MKGNFDEDFLLFHPQYSFDIGDSSFSNTLILTTTDFRAVDALFPLWKLKREVFERMVLVHPTSAEAGELQNLFYRHYGTVYEGISTEDFTRTTTHESVRGHRLYLFYYISSAILLAVFFICNMLRVIQTHMIDYAVHHLYGATLRMVMWRVGGFVLAAHLVPLAGILWVSVRSGDGLWHVLAISILVTLGLSLFAAGYTAKRIGTMKERWNLRGDY